jgi:hypothetical protein
LSAGGAAGIERDDARGRDATQHGRFALFQFGRDARAKIGTATNVFHRQPIEMFQRADFGHLHDCAAHLQRTQRVALLVGQQRHTRIGAHVLFFAKAAHGVDQHLIAVYVAPYHGGLRLPVGQNGGQHRTVAAFYQVAVSFGD